MTTDPFTTAARAEAEEQCGNDIDAEHFLAGVEWARAHLAEQEPTDAECIHILSVLQTDLGQPTRTDFEWSQAAINRCREALMSARRDEEKR